MSRGDASALLDEAVADSRITLLHGLPRVGRTAAVKHWCASRDNIALLSIRAPGRSTIPIQIFDHLELRDIDKFVKRFREVEQSAENVRFVVVPIDLMATNRLQEVLTGCITLITIDPLQPSDFIADHTQSFEPGGPLAELTAKASPTNATPLDPNIHWLRGGLPESLKADSDHTSLAWRRQMIDSLLVRDYSSWLVTAETKLPAILRWVANQNCGELNENGCPVVTKRVELMSALYVFERIGLTRRLPNFPEGTDASLGKKSKLFIRDSGILHALLGIETLTQLRAHGCVGDSWESYAIETLIVATAGCCTPQFYRLETADKNGEDEIDLVLDFRRYNGRLIAIECKLNPNASAKAGFHRAANAIGATDKFVVHSGPSAILGDKVDRLDLATALNRLKQISL